MKRRNFLAGLAAIPCMGFLKPAECCDELPDEIEATVKVGPPEVECGCMKLFPLEKLPANSVTATGTLYPGTVFMMVYNGDKWFEVSRSSRDGSLPKTISNG